MNPQDQAQRVTTFMQAHGFVWYPSIGDDGVWRQQFLDSTLDLLPAEAGFMYRLTLKETRKELDAINAFAAGKRRSYLSERPHQRMEEIDRLLQASGVVQ